MAMYPIKIAGALSLVDFFAPQTVDPSGTGEEIGAAAKFGQASSGFGTQAIIIWQFLAFSGDETGYFELMERDDGGSWTAIPGKKSQTYDSSSGSSKVVVINLDASELSKEEYTWRIVSTPVDGTDPRDYAVLHLTGDHRYGPGKDYDNADVVEIIL